MHFWVTPHAGESSYRSPKSQAKRAGLPAFGHPPDDGVADWGEENSAADRYAPAEDPARAWHEVLPPGLDAPLCDTPSPYPYVENLRQDDSHKLRNNCAHPA
jgi:hypothetical protein